MKTFNHLCLYCCLSILGTTFAQGQLQADFSHVVLSNPSCIQPTEAAHVQLNSNSSGPIARYEWYTDQPKTAQVALGAVAQNPVLNLNLTRGILPQSVLVTLVVHDTTGQTDTTSKSINTDFHFAPFVSFSPRYAISHCEEANIELTNMSSSPMGVEISHYSWDLGNGETSAETNPTSAYSEPGEYTIELTVTDETGCSSSSENSGVFLKLNLLSAEACE